MEEAQATPPCPGLAAGGGAEAGAVERGRANARLPRRRPPADRVAEHVRPAEPGGVDEPEIEPGEVVDALHPVGVARAAEAGMRRSPDREVLGNLLHPACPSPVAAGAVEHEQGIAPPTDPRVDVDAADRDRLLAGSHAT